MQNQTSFIRSTLYALKRNYGERIILIQRSETNIDYSSGLSANVDSSYTIKRAIRMPESSASNVNFGADFRHFRFGSQVDQGEKQFIVDARDIPSTVVIREGDKIQTNLGTYIVKEVTAFDKNVGYVITTKS